jgi:hypothetical protein
MDKNEGNTFFAAVSAIAKFIEAADEAAQPERQEEADSN